MSRLPPTNDRIYLAGCALAGLLARGDKTRTPQERLDLAAHADEMATLTYSFTQGRPPALNLADDE